MQPFNSTHPRLTQVQLLLINIDTNYFLWGFIDFHNIVQWKIIQTLHRTFLD
jgi:hypothetical protein